MDIITRVKDYVSGHIAEFHEARIEKLRTLRLHEILRRKNPYMFKAKNLEDPCDLVKSLIDAVCSSPEETIFGDWLEKLAIYVAGEVYDGKKSTTKGVDLEMDKDGIHYIISIKSGPNWSNSSSLNNQVEKFRTAQKVYRTGGNKRECKALIGCCYGKKNNPFSDPIILCGQSFWQFISDSDTLYMDIIVPLGTDAKAKNEAYMVEYNKLKTGLTVEFINEYCNADNSINWEKIVRLNAEARAIVE